MSRKKSASPITLFAFQDAITSVCGVVVLVTLMLALALTQRVVTEAESSTVAKSKVDEVRAMVEKLTADLAELNAQVEEAANVETAGIGLSVSEVKTQLANAKRRLEASREESRALDRRLEELEREQQSFSELEKQIDEIRRQIDEKLREAQETQAETISQDSAVYAFSDSVREKPWYVEVAGNKLVAHGSGGESETFTFSTAFEFAKWASTRPSGSEYFVLIVRPSGAKNYGFAVAELENEGYRYGVDLIGETRELLFLPSQGKERP